LHLHTCIHIVLHHIHPPTPFPCLPHWCQPPPCRTFSALLFSNFVEKKIKRKKKIMMFLLVWDKDSCAGSFLVMQKHQFS
jgi:hypothetical protein